MSPSLSHRLQNSPLLLSIDSLPYYFCSIPSRPLRQLPVIFENEFEIGIAASDLRQLEKLYLRIYLEFYLTS